MESFEVIENRAIKGGESPQTIALMKKEHDNQKNETLGCTDPQATNYDPNAKVNDGSCTYDSKAIEKISDKFELTPEYFGTGKFGDENRPSEEKAVEDISERIKGLGLKVETDKLGINAFKIISPEGEEDISIGDWNSFWPLSEDFGMGDENNAQKADRVNSFIDQWARQLEINDENFDYELYKTGFNLAKDKPTHVLKVDGDEHELVNIDGLSFDQLQTHSTNVYLDLMQNFLSTDEGRSAITDVNGAVTREMQGVGLELLSGIDVTNPTSVDQAAKQYVKLYDETYNDIFTNHPSILTAIKTNERVVSSLYDDKTKEVAKKENRKKEFGSFIGSSDFLTGLVRTTTLQIPQSMYQFSAIRRSDRMEKAYKMLEKVKGMSDDDTVYYGYMETGAPDEIIPTKNYTAGELKPLLLKQIHHHQFSLIENLIKSAEYQEKLNRVPAAHIVDQSTGEIKLTADNWQEALGDQTAQMFFSIFSLGFTTMTQEAGEAYSQIIEGKAKRKFSEEAWNDKTKEEKAKEMLKIVDAGEADINTAMTVGGVNMALDNISNLFFVGKMAPPAARNLVGKYYELWLKGKYRKVITDVSKNINYKDLTAITIVEGAVEGAQEETMMYGVGTSLDDYTRNPNRTYNAVATAMITTPILGGGTRTVSNITSEVYSRALAMRDPDGVMALCNEQGKEYTRLYNEGKIKEDKYDDLMNNLDALKRGFGSNEHKNVNDRESAMIIFNAQLDILRNEKLVNKNKKSIKEDDLTTDEELFKSMELAAAENKIKKAKEQQTKARKLNHLKQEILLLSDELNNNPEYKDWGVEVFESTDDAVAYLTSIGLDINMKHPVTGEGILDGFLEGNNEFVLDKETLAQLGVDYEGKGIAIVSYENCKNNIYTDYIDPVTGRKSGLWYSENAIAHGLEHIKMSTKSDEELNAAREDIIDIFENSTDPFIKQVEMYVQRRLLDYQASGVNLNSRAGIEEFFTAIGDVTTSLSLQHVSTESSIAFKEIGEMLNDLLYDAEGINKFDHIENIFGFFSHVKGDADLESNLTLEGGKPVQTFGPRGVLYSIVEEGQSDLDFIARNNRYKQNRSNEEVDLENKEIAKKILEAESYTNENKELQERVREGAKVHRNKLLENNFGLLTKTIKRHYKTDHPLHTKARESEFISAVLEQVSKAIITYDPKINDSFSAYYFGSNPKLPISKITGEPSSVADVRVAKIWEDMKQEFTEDISNVTNIPESDYTQDYILDINEEIDSYNERSALREKIPGMEIGSPKYDAWINSVNEIMSVEIDNVFNEDFASKVRVKNRNFNWKKLKETLGGYNSEKYNNWVEDNAEFLYNRMPQKVMNENYTEFTEVVIKRMGPVPSRLQKDVKNDYAGNDLRKKLEWNDEVKALWIEKLLKKDQVAQLKAEGLSNAEIHKIVRLDMAQESFLKHLSDILGKDAAMQVIQSPEFVKEHGIGKKQIMEAAMRLDRGMDVKFSIKGTEKGFIDGNTNAEFFIQETSRLIRLVEEYEDDNVWELVVAVIEQDKKATQPIKDFVISLYDKDAVVSAGEKYFKSETLKNTNISQKTRDKFKDNGAIRYNAEAKKKMMKNATTMANFYGREFMELVGFEFLGLKGGNRFLDISTRKQVSGWNNLTKEEKDKKKAKDPDAQWLKDSEGNFIRGEFTDAYTELQESMKTKDLPDNFNVEDVRIMNKDYGTVETSIFKRVIKILEKDITREEKLKELESSGLSAEIEAANVANIEAFVHISKGIAEQLKEGNLDEAGVLHMFQMQTNLAGGFRGLSRLDLMQVTNGSQKGTLWKGEHTQSMSETNAKVIDILFRYKNNPKGVNLDSELRAAFSEYGQIIGDKTLFDKLDDAGKTNVSGINRLALLDFNEIKTLTNTKGENVRDIQASIRVQNEIKAEVDKSQKKAKAKENIRLKNTKKGKVNGATVMDFDETVGVSENYIYATKEGETKKIPSSEWPVVGEQLRQEGWEFDFTDFNQVTDGKPGPLFQKLKNQIEKYGVKNVHILTARAPESAIAIQAWLKSMGVNMPIENITGLGNSTGEAKADWIEQNLILNGFNDIYFVDDAYSNVDAVRKKFDEYSGVLVKGGKAEIVSASKADTKNKVIFMIGGPGSGKSTIIDKAGFSENYTILNPDAIMEPMLKAEGLPLDISLVETKEGRSRWMQIMAQANKENKALIEKARQEGKGIIIDGTGASAKVMQNYIKLFTEAGYNVGAVSVQTSLETALQRNADRERSLIDRVVIDTWDKAQMNIGLYKELFGNNFFQVHTDNMTMEDALPADFVRDVSNFTLTNPIIKYSIKGTQDLNKTFNDILEVSTGIESKKTFSEAEGKIRGAKVNSVWDVMYPPSAYDFEMFTYRYISDGTLGENQKAFFEEKLFGPFAVANAKIDAAKQRAQGGYRDIIKQHPKVRKSLNDIIEGTNFSKQQALRVYLWDKAGFEIPGLVKTTKAKLLDVVNSDPELIMFADKLSILSQQKEGYLKPTEYWTVESIASDLQQMTGVVGRAEYLKEWKTNVNEIFSKENKAKLRAAFGNEHVEALEDMLYRMEYGRNRRDPGRIETAWNNWVNNSVGAIMFFNMRSAALQTISAANYIDWNDNSIDKVISAVANTPQFVEDFMFIMNSDMLVQRRQGLSIDVNTSELAARLKNSTNKPKAIIAALLEKGFLPTQFADSFAISLGGASYYRNKIKAYSKKIDPETGQKYTDEKAQELAWLDFQEKTQKGQQSSRPDLISQQQASGLGRLILAFKNTPMQYNRLMVKAVLDLKNNRGSTGENISKIAYYGAVQNLIFTSLQTALWSALGSEDDWDTKKERVANGMIDSILNGMGLTGAVAATIKNGYLRYQKEKKKGWNADHTRTIIEFANLSPTIGSKLRRLYGAIRTEQMNQEAIEGMGFTLENPAFNSMAQLVAATTNIPLDRAVQKCQNLILASKDETEFWDSFALVMGWNPWDLGIESTARKEQKKFKLKSQKEREAEKEDIKTKEKEEALKPVIEKEKKQEKEGKKTIFNCVAVNKHGIRCSNSVNKAGQRCTVHQKVEVREDGKQTKCKAKRTNGQPCNMMTTAKSGFCVYHD